MKQLALPIALARVPSLDDFVAGPNEAALAHLRLWAGSPTRSPVPTYLWGPPASGKTHLLQAVHQLLRSQGAHVGWMDASMAEPPPYDERWAVVLMDDVDQYSPVQQHAAFAWFVSAQALQCGVLAAGAAAPTHLALREDLRTRLGWGHVFGLQPLSEAECRAVLRKAADARGIFLGDEVMDFMLTRFSRDLGSLLQLLEQLDTFGLQTQRALTIPLIKSMLEQT